MPVCLILLNDNDLQSYDMRYYLNNFSETVSNSTVTQQQAKILNGVNLILIWEMTLLCLGMSVFLLKYIIIGSEINKKYLSTSVLLTEQMNIYFKMEKHPEKKESLNQANSVLQLCQRLLSELESPYKVSGIVMSPFLFQIVRAIILSAFSGVISEFLGFKLKLWKIKAG